MVEEKVEVSVPFQELVLENNKNPEEEEEEERAEDLVKEMRKILGGYEFKDKILLLQAFTHQSYKEDDCSSYERLEFIGDSVLDIMITRELYFLHPDLNPGQLTKLRAANVDNEKLARVAVEYNLHKFLRHDMPLLAAKIEEFSNDMKEYPLHSFGLIDAPKVLGDIVESLIGAIFIDSNSSMDKTWEVLGDIVEYLIESLYIDSMSSMDKTWEIIKILLVPIVTPSSLKMHPVTRLYELCQKNGFKVEIRDYWKKTGEFEIFVDDDFVGRGKYTDKKSIAFNRAAHDAFCNLIQIIDKPSSSNLKLF